MLSQKVQRVDVIQEPAKENSVGSDMQFIRSRTVSTSEQKDIAWETLLRYRDIEYTRRHIYDVHNISNKHDQNVRKQASHIRMCIIQAEELFQAAESVSYTTKPILLYYCAMHLAIAEILLKQTGDSSLDRARDKYRHHGLTFHISPGPREMSFEGVASSLTARRMFANGNPGGTFELWRQSARKWNIFGESTRVSLHSSTQSTSVILSEDDIPLNINWELISLYQCILHIPGLIKNIHFDLPATFVRGSLSEEIYLTDGKRKITTVVHPTSPILLEQVLDRMIFHPQYVNHISGNVENTHAIFNVEINEQSSRLPVNYPNSSNITENEVAFFIREWDLRARLRMISVADAA